MDAVIQYTLNQEGNEEIRSVNAVVGETNDGYLNDIRSQLSTDFRCYFCNRKCNGK
ncbi:P1 family peptidase [Antarcticibacterium sp. 1MA-6-2]|uniref:P1 family peptidase n=1 Tax=Antarcticibacterium sp. 1MA-6-2 TaxID=2908210 RepID=UPI0021079E39|nr:P1 family peptidase [Antarcticibacterium sp. 1MA-6-2]